MKKPVLSVITVTLNSENTLPKLLESINMLDEKDADDVEFIFKDGSSSDETLRILEKLDLSNKVVISVPDKGIYDAMNFAISSARGKYLYFINSDDYFFNESSLSNILLNIRNQSETCVFTFNYWISGYDCIWDVEGFKIPCHQAIVVPKCDARFNLSLGHYADGEFMDYYFTKYRAKHCRETIAIFNLGGVSNSSSLTELTNGLNYYKKSKIALKLLLYKIFGERNLRSFIYWLRGVRKVKKVR